MSELYNISVKDIELNSVDLSNYQGKTLLIVNVASKCGFTPQYKDLQSLYEKYRDQGLEVLGFPCNQFGAQEPGSNAAVQEFCQLNYGLSFPVMGKIEVNGSGQHPLYAHLSKQAKGLITDSIKWNFTKFLVNRDGLVIERFAPVTKPEAISKNIEELL